jgi:hypothetical protein
MPKSILSGRWRIPKGKDGHFLFRDITGERFGRLIALRPTKKRLNGHIAWMCLCDCGRKTLISGKKLRIGHTRSCGCWKREGLAATHGATRGRTKTVEYATWSGMLRRCRNQNSADFQYYGARGIKVCKRWLKFENFLADMGLRPDGYSIERIDNDGNYEPRNCKWIPMQENRKHQKVKSR